MDGDENSSLVEQRHGEQILASACRFLAEGGEDELAGFLAKGALAARPRTELHPFFGDERSCLDLDFVAPRALYEALDADPQWDERAAALWNAIDAVVPAGYVGGAPVCACGARRPAE